MSIKAFRTLEVVQRFSLGAAVSVLAVAAVMTGFAACAALGVDLIGW